MNDSLPKQKGVSEWSMDECFDYLEREKIEYAGLDTIQEMQELIRQHLQEINVDSERHNSQKQIEDVLSQDKKINDKLLEIYKSLISFVNSDLDHDTSSIIKELRGDFKQILERKKEELGSNDCPIVVAGETSAGKSSLLNLILDADVLPHHQLCATSTICRLHNSTNKKIEIILKNGETITKDINNEDPKAAELLKEELKPYTHTTELREKSISKQVEIYWPIPMLQDRVTIVDTPGVGESEEMTERLLECLPNAVAFIYVINSSNAGGIQEDKLVQILKKQKLWELEGKILPLDFSSTMFVCNKWDVVENSEEEENVWKDTLKQLKKVIPEIDEKHVFKMSVKEAENFRRSGMGNSPKFRTFQDGFTELIQGSLSTKLKRHYKFLDMLMSEVESKLSSRIEYATRKNVDFRKLRERVTTRLEKLKLDTERVQMELTSVAITECYCVVDKLLLCLRSPEVQKRLLTWQEHEVPDMILGDFQVTKLVCEKAIYDRLMTVLIEIEEKERLVKQATELLTTKFRKECAVLEDDCATLNLELAGIGSIQEATLSSYRSIDHQDVQMSTGAKVALAVTAPIWIPVTLAIAVLCLPVAIGVTVIDGFKMKDFKKYKVSYMERWTSEALKNTFNEKNLREFLFEIYNKHFKSKLDELCEDFIPKQIAADERQLDLIIKDSTISDKIVELLEPTLVKLNKIQEQLKMFEIFYLTKYIIDPRDIHIKEETDKGKFSDVCLAMWNHDNEETIVAVKVLERNLNYPDLPRNLKLKDIEMLRRLMHQNIVEVYGLCYIPDGDEGNESRLTLVMENCEENLESVVFGNIHLQCGNFRTSAERKNAFMFYVRMATAVCDGLADMHKRGFFSQGLETFQHFGKEQHSETE